MWKWLHPYAKPDAAYQLCGKLLPWFASLGFLFLAVGTVLGLAYAPADYQQGDSFRIIYIHVPAAIWSMGVYMSMAIAAFIGIVWQLRISDMAALAMAPIGAVYTFIALSLVLFGANRCGEPGGCGMRVSPLSLFCCFSI